jgi:hypothetical protein
MRRLKTVVALALTAALWGGCSVFPELPPRPPNVPQDAIRLTGSKTQWWVKCAYRPPTDVCTVYNSGGKVLYDNAEYRPYDGGDPVAERDLRIAPERSSIQVLYLKNGRIIILARAFDFQKRVVDADRGQHR